MEILQYTIPLSILTFLIGIVLLVVVGIKVYVDVKETRQSRRLHQLLIRMAKQISQQPISVIIELDRKADSIFTLIDHLYEQQYPKLEVVVIIKQTAGKKAQTQLINYRRRKNLKSLRIIKHKKGLTVTQTVSKYASGNLVVKLLANNRVSATFFSDVSLDSLSSTYSVIVPRTHIKLDTSVRSGMLAHISVWQRFFSRLRYERVLQVMTPGVVYNRKALIKGGIKPSAPACVSRQAYVSTLGNEGGAPEFRLRKKYSVIVILGVIGLITVFSAVNAEERIILAIFLVSLYLVVHTGLQIGLKGYSLLDKVNLVLLTPFGLLSTLATLIMGVQKSIFKTKS